MQMFQLNLKLQVNKLSNYGTQKAVDQWIRQAVTVLNRAPFIKKKEPYAISCQFLNNSSCECASASIDASKKRALANLRCLSRRFGLPRLPVLPTEAFIILVFTVTLRKDITENAFI